MLKYKTQEKKTISTGLLLGRLQIHHLDNCDACKLVVIYRMDVNEFDAFDVFIESHSIDHTQPQPDSRQVHCVQMNIE